MLVVQLLSEPSLHLQSAGVFSKQIIDGASLDSTKDLILLIGVGALVFVGVFATELAAQTFDRVQAEMDEDAKVCPA